MQNKQQIFSLLINGNKYEVTDQQLADSDIVETSPGNYSLLENHTSVTASILDVNLLTRSVKLELDNEIFHVEIKDELDMLIESMGFNKSLSKGLKQIVAPMPGVVLEIAVQEGDSPEAGEKLLILEAMKMENVITLPVAAKIGKVLIKKGQAVSKGQLLIELENE